MKRKGKSKSMAIKNKKDVVTPMRVYSKKIRQLPKDFFEKLDAAWREAKAAGTEPPEYTHYDHSTVRRLAAGKSGNDETHFKRLALRDTAVVLANWRLTKGIYRFDPSLCTALDEADVGNIPIRALGNLPEYAPYIVLDDVKVLNIPVHGAWVSYIENPFSGELVIYLLCNVGDGDLMGLGLAKNDKTIAENVEQIFSRMKKEGALSGSREEDMLRQFYLGVLHRMLPRVLYLCSKEPDLSGIRKPSTSKVMRGKSWIEVHDEPEAVNEVEVGYRYGAAIRMWQEKRREEGKESAVTGLTVAPHVRRAHWHLYWTGKGRETPVSKWVAPTLVGYKAGEEIVPTIRPVKAKPTKPRSK